MRDTLQQGQQQGILPLAKSNFSWHGVRLVFWVFLDVCHGLREITLWMVFSGEGFS